MTRHAVCWLILGLLLCTCCAGRAEEEKTPSADPQGGAKLLQRAGIKQATDITGAVVSWYREGTCRLTREQDAAALDAIYQGLHSAVYHQDSSHFGLSGIHKMVLSLKNGKPVRFAFVEEPNQPGDTPTYVFLNDAYYSESLLPALQSIRKNARAAADGGRVPEFQVARLTVRKRDGSVLEVDVDSEKGKAIIAAARILADWVDPRDAFALDLADVDDVAGCKLAAGAWLDLVSPISLSCEAVDRNLSPNTSMEGYSQDISYKDLQCDQIAILAFNHSPLASVAFRNRATGRYCVTWNYLTRRYGERYQVEKLGFPGHPASDWAYYQSPDDVLGKLLLPISELPSK